MAENQRTALWNALLDAEMNQCYWLELSQKYADYDLWLKVAVAVLATGSALSSFSIWNTHPNIWKTITVITSFLSIYHSLFYSAERLQKISGLALIWKETAISYQLLWDAGPGVPKTEVWDKFTALKEKEKQIDESRFKTNKRLHLRVATRIKERRTLS